MNFLIILCAKYLFLLVITLAVLYFFMGKKTAVKNNLLKLGVIALPLSLAVAKILSKFFYDPRPFATQNVMPLIPHAADNGFPSDHTLLAMTIAAIIFTYNKKLGLILFLIGVVVGIARVAAKVHSPIDIIGSTIISFLAVMAAKRALVQIKQLDSILDKILSKFKR